MDLKNKTIDIPYNFEPREYQKPFLTALDEGVKRFVIVWHRRAGKDKTCVAIVPKILLQRVGLALHVFPTLKQGREIIWEGRDNDGFKFIDHIPPEIRAKEPNESRMSIELNNGSIYRVAGADKPDSLRGGNGTMYIFSEWAMHDPMVWHAVVQPIVRQNNGIAIFNFTPLGKNHAYNTFKHAEKDKEWFSQILSVDDTKTLGKEELKVIRQEYLDATGDDALFYQEYYCSFDSPVQGAYYGKWIKDAMSEKRITDIGWEPKVGVDTWWDIGIGDATAIWFTQAVGNSVRLIDYYEATGEGLPHYIKMIKEKDYIYRSHNAPHDIKVREWTSGKKTRYQIAKGLGIKFNILSRLGREDGIEAAREIFPRCWFDKTKCDRGIEALKGYQKKWNEATKEYSSNPAKTWHCHGSDAFRYMAVGTRDEIKKKNKGKKISTVDYKRLLRRAMNPLAGF